MLPAIDTAVKFIKEYGNYHTGQVAAFSAEMANRFFAVGIAVPAGAPSPQDTPKTRSLRDKIVRKA